MLSEDTIILFGITPGVTDFHKVEDLLKNFMEKKKEIDYNDRFNIIFFTKEGPKYFEDFTLQPSYLLEKLNEFQSEIIEADIAGGIFIAAMYVVEVFKKISGKCFRMIILSDGGSKKVPEKQIPFLSDLLEKITDMPFIIDAVRINGNDPRDDLRLMRLARRTGGDLYEVDELTQESPEPDSSKEEKDKSIIDMLEKLSRTPLNLAKKLKKEEREGEGEGEDAEEEEQFKDLKDVLDHLKGKKKVESELFEVSNIDEIPPNEKMFYEGLADPLEPVSSKENKRCIICFTSLKNQELLQCPNCHNHAHKICFAIWAKESNIGIPYLFRCPNCYNLIKMNEELIRKVNTVKTPTIEVCKDLENICLEEYLESLESPGGPKVVTSEEGNLSGEQEKVEVESKQQVAQVSVSETGDTTPERKQYDAMEGHELKMIWCPHCSKMITNEYVKCPACGYKLKKAERYGDGEYTTPQQEEAKIITQISELKVKEKSDLKAKKFEQAIRKAQKIIDLANQLEKTKTVQDQQDFIEKVKEKRENSRFKKEFNRKFSYLKNKISTLLDHREIMKAHQAVLDFSTRNEELIATLDTPEYEQIAEKIEKIYQEQMNRETREEETEKFQQTESNAIEREIWEKLDEKEGEMKSMIGEIMKLNEARKESTQLIEEHNYEEAINILKSAIDQISSEELSKYKKNLQDKIKEIVHKKEKHKKLENQLKKMREDYDQNVKNGYFHAALYDANKIRNLTDSLGKFELSKEFSEHEKDLEEKIADKEQQDISERKELKTQLQALEDTIKVEYFDDDLIPLVKKYHLDDLEKKRANSEKIVEMASDYLEESRKNMKEKITQELIIHNSASEVLQTKKELPIKKIETKKKIKAEIFKKNIDYQIKYRREISAKGVDELTVHLKIPYLFRLTSLRVEGQEFIDLAIKQPTRTGLKYSFLLENISLPDRFTFHYHFEKRIARVLIFTKANYLYLLKCYYNISAPQEKGNAQILLPFDIDNADSFNWLIIEDIFPEHYGPFILEPHNWESMEVSDSSKGKLVGWILNNISAGTYLFQYLLVSPRKLALLTNHLEGNLQEAGISIRRGNLIDFKKKMEHINRLLEKELKNKG